MAHVETAADTDAIEYRIEKIDWIAFKVLHREAFQRSRPSPNNFKRANTVLLPAFVFRGCALMFQFLAIEMKRSDRRDEKNGGLTVAEMEWLEAAEENDAFTMVCYSAQEADKNFDEYMRLPVNKNHRVRSGSGGF